MKAPGDIGEPVITIAPLGGMTLECTDLMKQCRVFSNHPCLDPVNLFVGTRSVCQNSIIRVDIHYLSALSASSLDAIN